MRLSRTALLVALVHAAAGCGTASDEPPPTVASPSTSIPAAATPAARVVSPPSADALATLARASNAFGLDLYQRLRTAPGNLTFSPASISTALAMTWGGARGATAEQMKRVLHFEGTPEEVMQTSGALAASLHDPSRPLVFRIANRLFGEKTYAFKPAYLEATRAAYGAALETLDFKGAAETSRRRINGWVEQQTEKRIQDLVPAGVIDSETRLVLVNAIYFLGDWDEPFTKSATRPAPFYTSATLSKDVPTMHRVDRLRFAQRDGVKALELPYKGGSMSMLLVLPDQKDGLPAVEGSLTAARLDELVRALEAQQVRVSLPKFEVNPAAALALRDALVTMGMTEAFDRQRADFSGIADPPDPRDRLFIGAVLHKAFVRTDEKGTEAAAATAVVMPRAAGMPAMVAEFTADHPFLFFIRDNASGLVVFMGRVADPSLK